MNSKPKSLLHRVLPLLKIVIAALALFLVFKFTPWHDELVLPAEAGQTESRTFSGRALDVDDDSAQLDCSEFTIDVTLWPGTDFCTVASWRTGVVSNEWRTIGLGDPTAASAADQVEHFGRLSLGLKTVLRLADWSWLILALGLIFVATVIAVYRWGLLLRGVDLGIPFGRAFNLTFIGAFFNNVMPGLTGGDLVKAIYIAREHPNRKTEAIITVLLDRVLGFTGLALVAGLAIPTDLERYGAVAPGIFLLLGILTVFSCVFFSRRIRAAVRLDALLKRLPFQGIVQKIDRAVFLYRFRLDLVGVSLLLSMVVHTLIIGGFALIGHALHIELDTLTYFAVIPISLIAAAVPLTPGGLGIAEAANIYFLGTVGVSCAAALSLFFLYRILQVLVSLVGAVCLALQKDRVSSAEVEEFEEDGTSRPPQSTP
ncbi:MAG: flippase-like domain-containing protein [Planctomycetes bacterium]|nr:flippase-like domain-containing protein [Planctomycetota bacterium]